MIKLAENWKFFWSLFQELIRTERARELQEQRMAEEVAARAAALKELSGSGGLRNQA